MSRDGKVELEDVSSLKEGTPSVRQLESTFIDGTASEDEIFLDGFSAKEQNRIFRKPQLKHCLLTLRETDWCRKTHRANIGNAKIEGLETSLDMSGSDYNVASMVFFISYIICEGLIMTFSGFAQSFGGFVAARFLLGIPEAGFFPGAMYILSQWYPPHRTQFRVALMYGAAAMSGAFSGLLAAGIAQMRGLGGLLGWQWIFILEGVMTVLGGLICYFVLPDSPDLSGWLTDRERRFLNLTHARYRGSKKSKESSAQVAVPEKKPKGHWGYVWRQLHWASYCSVPTYALKFTLPQIIRNMGFTNNQAQLLTVPPYFLGGFSAVFSSMLADKLRWRYPFICGPQMLLCISYAVLFVYAADIRNNVALCYTFVNISTIASYPIVPGGNTWTLNNLAGQEKRAMGIAFMITLGNLGGIVGSFIFRDDEKPRYPTGWGACLGFVAAGVVSASLLELCYLTINKRRARKSEDEVRAEYTDEKLEKMGNNSPLFRYSL
ncbi:hypothetical protein KVR01_013285 [Diaporthe batatas]|uniref:uncharacterized protein n=1 Tax=Diaporthe batatas TaxID=748121 RepID=UPI001D0539FE|nr:uncharacterized protein KVR01_013285 [Diaporthe batatas]KAG8156872.1 hypothetical protein KVR01_013285 [Diaporthe batatas]